MGDKPKAELTLRAEAAGSPADKLAPLAFAKPGSAQEIAVIELASELGMTREQVTAALRIAFRRLGGIEHNAMPEVQA